MGIAVTGQRRRRAAVLAAAATLAALAGGCGGHVALGRPEDSPAPPTTAGPMLSVRLGFLGQLDGPGSALSRAVKDGEQLAVSQFASKGQDVDVSVVAASTGTTAAGAAAAAHRLVDDGVAAVVGPQTGTEVLGSAKVLDAAGIPDLTATATATELSAQGWSSFFRVVANDRQQGVATARELVGGLHASDLALFAGDTACDRELVDPAADEATNLGADVTVRATLATGAAEAAAAREVVGDGVAGVYFCGSGPATVRFVGALVADGYQGSVVVASELPASVLTSLGTSADGTYVVSPATDPAVAASSGGRALVFDDAYRAAFGTQPPIWSAEAYDATNAVLAAVKAGSSTAPDIDTYLSDHPTAGVTATISFGPTGNQVDPPVFVSQVRAGRPVQFAVASQTSP